MDSSTAGAAALKRLRTRRGLSLADTARALTQIAQKLGMPRLPQVASVQRSIARWESKSTTMPDERYQLLLAYLYATTPGGSRSLGAGSDFAQYLDALREMGESDRRIAELRNTLVRAVTDDGGGLLGLLAPQAGRGLVQALADASFLDAEIVAGLASVVADVNAQVGSLPFVRLQLMLAPALEACRRLMAVGGPPPGLRECLRSTWVEAAVLAGRLEFETRDDAASRALYEEATRESGRLRKPWRQASVHLSHALTVLYASSDIANAAALVEAAVRAAGSGESRLIRARAHALQAEVAARLGQARQSRAALGLARYDIERQSPDDPLPGAFSAEYLRGFEGVCHLYVGDPVIAHDQFAASANSLGSPRQEMQRIIVATDQALARIRLGEPHAAADLLHECIAAAASTGGRVAMIRLRRARRELRPWCQEGFVADVDDHLMDVLGW
ncbi:helix-turn-helix domain-containing protein [Streptomyces sp. NPDC088394]|uniref:helix-turn-helix domain-containing protein n=1 Tax=Streptomyces sp. NPDC088394 TaxID=3365860 RepID=UPI0037FCF1E6